MVGDDSGFGAFDVRSEVLQGPGGVEGLAGVGNNMFFVVPYLCEDGADGVEGDVGVEAKWEAVVGEYGNGGGGEVVPEHSESLLACFVPVEGCVFLCEQM